MSNQVLPAGAGCRAPMVHEPLGEQDAAEPARMFKALADPVRPRPLSLMASHEGGAACVCDLTAPFDVSRPTISLWAVQAGDMVITMGRGDACAIFLGKRYADRRFGDPAGQGLDAVHPVRDQTATRVRAPIGDLLPGEAA